MSSFRSKTGRNAASNTGSGISINVKGLGRTISSLTSVADPADLDGDGDGFVTGRDGKDNVPFKAPVKKISDLWSDKKQKALEADEQRIIAVAKKLKGRKPKYNIKEINDIVTNVRTREDVTRARREVRQLAKSIFEVDGIGQNGEYKTRLFKGKDGVAIFGRKNRLAAAQQEHPYTQIVVSGEILDKNGDRVGLFSRMVYLDGDNAAKKPHAYHEYLRIDEEQKGQGIGSDFTLATENMYKQMGIEEVHLNAALSDGAYTWLRAGYQFKTDEDRKTAAKTIEERYQMMLKDAGSKEKLVAGGFKTAAGRHYSDPGEPGEPLMMPKPLFESTQDLDNFLKILGQLKTHKVGSEQEVPPIALTLFGTFSKKMLKGVVINVKKPISPPTEQKSLRIKGFDKLFTRV